MIKPQSRLYVQYSQVVKSLILVFTVFYERFILMFNALLTLGLRSPYFWHKEHCLSSSLDHPVSKSAFERRPLFPAEMYRNSDLKGETLHKI